MTPKVDLEEPGAAPSHRSSAARLDGGVSDDRAGRVRDAPVSHEASAADRLSGLAAFRQRRFDAATTHFARWQALEPDNAVAWFCAARGQWLAGMIGDARLSCERALALDPSLLRAHLLLARLGARTDNAGVRIAALKGAIGLRPGAVAMRVALIAVMLRRVKYKAAMAVAKEALALAPSDPDVMLANVRCHVALGQTARAETLLRRLEETAVHPASLEAARVELATRLRRMAETAAPPPPEERDGAIALVRRDLAGSDRRPETVEPDLGEDDEEAAVALLPEQPRVAREPYETQITLAALVAAERHRPRTRVVDHILIVRALILRELQLRHRDNRLGVLVELIRPAIVVIAHYWLFYVLRKPMPGQIPIEVYVLAGFAVWFAFNGTWAGATTGGKWPGGATMLPGVTDLHLRVAKAGWQLLLNLAFCLVALVPMKLFGSDIVVPNVPRTFLIFGIAATMGFGLGLCLERLAQLVSLVKTAEKLLTWALFVTSGLYFSMASTPALVADWFWYNPMLHLIEFQREAFYPGYPVALLDIRYPIVVAAVLLTMGLLMYKAVRCPAHD